MSAERIDVLAVMDSAIGEYTNPRFTDRHGTGPELIAARAAVAELIEADKAYDAAIVAEADAEASGDDDLICASVRQIQWAKDRRASAIARVGAA